MPDEEHGPHEDPKLLFARMDTEEQAARLALAGEPDPVPYDARIAEAYRLRSEGSGASPREPAPAASAEL